MTKKMINGVVSDMTAEEETAFQASQTASQNTYQAEKILYQNRFEY